mgnify:FL=1|tara:strand:+ start:314 stop:577 length:264 start_codon:yes stop_codon:yes gene_type:complete
MNDIYNISRNQMIERHVALPMYYIRGAIEVYMDCTEDLVIECIENSSEEIREGYDTLVKVNNRHYTDAYMIMVNADLSDWREGYQNE